MNDETKPDCYEISLPSGKGGFAQQDLPPAGALRCADELLDALAGTPDRLGDSDVAEGWWVETHTLGCRDHADEAREVWWDAHYDTYAGYASDGISCVVGDPEDGYFVTLTPQRAD